MNCPQCQSPVSEGAAFCSLCGAQFGAAPDAAQLPGATALPASASLAALEAIAARDFEVRIGPWISRGWEIYKANFGVILGSYLVTILLVMAGGMVPMGSYVVGGPLFGGLILMVFGVMRGRPAEFNQLFDRFKFQFLPLFLVYLVKSLLVGIGLLLCLIPGIYLGVSYLFALHLVVDKKAEFWPAMETSRKLIGKHWGGMFLFGLTLFGINLLGVLALCVGALFTAPLMVCSICAAYEDIVGLEPETAPAQLAIPA